MLSAHVVVGFAVCLLLSVSWTRFVLEFYFLFGCYSFEIPTSKQIHHLLKINRSTDSEKPCTIASNCYLISFLS